MLPYFCSFLFLFLYSPAAYARSPPIFTVSPKDIPSATNNHSNRWHEFTKFQNASRGSLVPGISKLKKYFTRFGYLEADHVANSTEEFDENLETAIARYQTNLGLAVTGKLDHHTISELMSPRCGVADALTTLHGTQKYVYFTGQPRWARSIPMTLTYAFSANNLIKTLSMDELRGTFQRAFGHWASVIPVTFIESDDYGFADIKIGFYYGDHGDGEAFDGVLGVLAHAYTPESGQFHLDAAETWTVNFNVEKSHSAVDLESVATHEIGHLLGLAHTNVKDAVMYPSLRPRERKIELQVDDIKGVQALYGSNPNFSFQAFSESDLSLSDAADWKAGAESIRFSWLLLVFLWFG